MYRHTGLADPFRRSRPALQISTIHSACRNRTFKTSQLVEKYLSRRVYQTQFDNGTFALLSSECIYLVESQFGLIWAGFNDWLDVWCCALDQKVTRRTPSFLQAAKINTDYITCVFLLWVDGDEWGMDTLREEKHADTAEDALQVQESESTSKNTLSVVQVESTEGLPHHCKYCWLMEPTTLSNVNLHTWPLWGGEGYCWVEHPLTVSTVDLRTPP